MIKLLWPTLPLILLISCGRKFEPRNDWKVNWFSNLDSVPIVAIMRIGPRAVTPVGRPFTVNWIPFRVELFKANVTVENVLKGDLRTGPSRVFYNTMADVTGPPDKIGLYGIRPFRVLLLLRRENGELRTVCDASLGCIASVHSGFHSNFNARGGAHLPESIIDFLLTRGSGADDLGIVQAVFAIQEANVSLPYTMKSLLRLANEETAPVRVAACLEFRDILTQDYGNVMNPLTRKQLTLTQKQLARQFGIAESERSKWTREMWQNGWARNWWQGGDLDRRTDNPQIAVTAAATRLKGLDLCINDAALGVPPLHN